MGSRFFSALYGIYTVTLNELKAVLKVSAQAGQSGGVNKTSLESTAQSDDFREVKTRKRRYSDDTSQTAKKSAISVPKSAAFKLPIEAVPTRNFFAPLGTNDMHTEKEAPRKSGRPPPVVVTSTTNLIRLQRRVRVAKYTKWNSYHNKRNGGLFSHEILPGEK
jgi:hypothetical protein